MLLQHWAGSVFASVGLQTLSLGVLGVKGPGKRCMRASASSNVLACTELIQFTLSLRAPTQMRRGRRTRPELHPTKLPRPRNVHRGMSPVQHAAWGRGMQQEPPSWQWLAAQASICYLNVLQPQSLAGCQSLQQHNLLLRLLASFSNTQHHATQATTPTFAS